MPGKVLIIDDVATNRIVLKVKLVTSCYRVIQAMSGAEGLELAKREHPDVILCSARLPDMDAMMLAETLRNTAEISTIPLIVITSDLSRTLRINALKAGVDDILNKPLNEYTLLARIRSLLRARDTAEELRLRDGTNRALGFAEKPQGFTAPGNIAIIADTQTTALHWKRNLGPLLPDSLQAMAVKDAMLRLSGSAAPDVYAVALDPENPEPGLRLMADLRAHSKTRHSAILAVSENDTPRIAADALDRGANDIMPHGFEAAEMALRLTAQITRKRIGDRLRENMRDGLRAAVTDPLTGLFNRRYAIPHLARIAEKSNIAGRDYAVMAIDLDHFKRVNDCYGHAAGDAVLVEVARILQMHLRAVDLAARIGGEEFLIVMPETNRHCTSLAAKRLCDIIHDTPFKIPGQPTPIRITVSIGVALGTDQIDIQSNITQGAPIGILEEADKALYGSKAHGRNQVTFSEQTAA